MPEHQITPSLAAEIAAATALVTQNACVAMAIKTLMAHQDPMIRGLGEVIEAWAEPHMRASAPMFTANTVERFDVVLADETEIRPVGGLLGTIKRRAHGWAVRTGKDIQLGADFTFDPPAEVTSTTNYATEYKVSHGTVIRCGFAEIVLVEPDIESRQG